MSSGSMSFLDKLKDIFSKIFKGKKTKSSSFKTPQELQRSRYGTAATIPSPTSPKAGSSRPAEISQTPSAPAPTPAPAPIQATAPAQIATHQSPEQSRASTTVTTPIVNNSIPRIKEAERSADVSPTEPPTFRTDRPHSGAVSALEQELVSDRVNKTNDAEAIQEENDLKPERPISDIAPADSVHTAQSPIITEKTEDIAATQHEQPAPINEAENIAEPTIEEPEVKEPVVDEPVVDEPLTEEIVAEEPMAEQSEHKLEPLPADRIDPTTAPEVVNKFDDEKVPVIAEPPIINSPVETKFRMSATSGPLEDFPANGEYYA